MGLRQNRAKTVVEPANHRDDLVALGGEADEGIGGHFGLCDTPAPFVLPRLHVLLGEFDYAEIKMATLTDSERRTTLSVEIPTHRTSIGDFYQESGLFCCVDDFCRLRHEASHEG